LRWITKQGQDQRSTLDPEVLNLGRTAKYRGVSETTIKKLVASGIPKKEHLDP